MQRHPPLSAHRIGTWVIPAWGWQNHSSLWGKRVPWATFLASFPIHLLHCSVGMWPNQIQTEAFQGMASLTRGSRTFCFSIRWPHSPHKKPSAHPHIEAELEERDHHGNVEYLVSAPVALDLVAQFGMLWAGQVSFPPEANTFPYVHRLIWAEFLPLIPKGTGNMETSVGSTERAALQPGPRPVAAVTTVPLCSRQEKAEFLWVERIP